jgi:DUF4097 and DUF4098 domain-containing protein YvlB
VTAKTAKNREKIAKKSRKNREKIAKKSRKNLKKAAKPSGDFSLRLYSRNRYAVRAEMLPGANTPPDTMAWSKLMIS